jgi:hypothetical protein
VKPRRSRDVVQVRVPADQAPLFHIPGPHGGWFASLLYGHQSSVDVPMRQLRELIAGSHGGVHAGIIATEEKRFRRPRRGRKRSDDDQR